MENVEKLGRYTGKVVVLNQTDTGRQYDELRRNISISNYCAHAKHVLIIFNRYSSRCCE